METHRTTKHMHICKAYFWLGDASLYQKNFYLGNITTTQPHKANQNMFQPRKINLFSHSHNYLLSSLHKVNLFKLF